VFSWRTCNYRQEKGFRHPTGHVEPLLFVKAQFFGGYSSWPTGTYYYKEA
jgi:hypothetical protein